MIQKEIEDDIVDRLEKRAEIRRSITTRKSVQEGKPDRIAELLEEAAREILKLRNKIIDIECELDFLLVRTAGEDY